jgi:hypothetical protein
MGMTAALKLRQIVENAERVLAIELMAAAQGLDHRMPPRPAVHDWPDAECRTILKRCRERVSSGDRLLVVEMVPVPGQPDAGISMLDMAMMMFGGEARQRTEAAEPVARSGSAELNRRWIDRGIQGSVR